MSKPKSRLSRSPERRRAPRPVGAIAAIIGAVATSFLGGGLVAEKAANSFSNAIHYKLETTQQQAADQARSQQPAKRPDVVTAGMGRGQSPRKTANGVASWFVGLWHASEKPLRDVGPPAGAGLGLGFGAILGFGALNRPRRTDEEQAAYELPPAEPPTHDQLRRQERARHATLMQECANLLHQRSLERVVVEAVPDAPAPTAGTFTILPGFLWQPDPPAAPTLPSVDKIFGAPLATLRHAEDPQQAHASWTATYTTQAWRDAPFEWFDSEAANVSHELFDLERTLATGESPQYYIDSINAQHAMDAASAAPVAAAA